ncbi:uncharacterized protein LOC124496271 [Dermatophagoides farinae]
METRMNFTFLFETSKLLNSLENGALAVKVMDTAINLNVIITMMTMVMTIIGLAVKNLFVKAY